MNTNPQDLVYLKNNIALEPLVDQWYAWPHLLSPATAARNITERNLKIMKSYIQMPQIHAAAVKKVEMRGGPFIDYDGGRVSEIKSLLEQTIEKRKLMLELSNAIRELDEMLQKEAKGFSLEPLYEKVPDILRGYVELFYDLHNRPSFRFYESLLYNKFYDNSAESIALQLLDSDDSRSFILSTPRLEEEKIISLSLPFSNPAIDSLFKMRQQPFSYSVIKNLLNIPEDKEEVFKSFFTSDPPKQYKKYDGPGIRTRYFGHACILVETKEISVLVDPLVSYGYETELSRYTYEDLPEEIDYVLITHNHQDHVVLETLLQLRNKIKNIVVPRCSMGDLADPSLKLMLNKIGFKNVIELSDMEEIEQDKCKITGLPFLGEHGDLDIRSKLCYHVKLHNDFSLLFVADSCNKEPLIYEHIQSAIGNIDVVFLGMECDGAPLSWLYGPLMPNMLEQAKDHTRRLSGSNFEQGMKLVNCFQPKDVFVYAMGMEPWLEFISSIKYTDESRPIVESNKLVKACIDSGINGERLYGEKTIEYAKDKESVIA
jgi:L-ascorbate metabolism protein UlaG (beta-lactamase superfamily)